MSLLKNFRVKKYDEGAYICDEDLAKGTCKDRILLYFVVLSKT
jgi:hypothetical protein